MTIIQKGELMGDLISRQAAIDALDVGAEVLRRVLDEADVVGVERAKYEWGLGLIESHIADVNDLPSAQPEQRWITSGKPMNSGMYLVTLRQKFEGEEAYGVRIMRFINGNWMLPKHFPEWINEEIEQEVLAWMPLPEPWKEGEAE